MRPRATPGGLALGAAAFAALYYAVARGPGADLRTDLLLLAPPVLALSWLLRASREPGRAKWFWRLLALGPLLWLAGEALWSLADYEGRAPRFFGDRATGFPLGTDLFFIGFLVPMIGAVGLRPHPRSLRRDRVALADTALVFVALSFVFLRIVFLPLITAEGTHSRSFVLGGLAFALAAWTATLWRRVEEPRWRRTYGAVCLFAVLYGTLSAVANGLGHEMLPPGGPADAGWFVPFFLLAAATTTPRARVTRRLSSAAVVLAAGPAPLVLDRVLGRALPSLGLAVSPQPILLLVTSALLAVGCAARLLVEERLDEEAQARERAADEAARRAGRLGTLAALSAGLVEELERATDEVARQARSAAPFMGAKAERVVDQAERARGIVRELSAAFRLVPSRSRQPVDVGRALEDTVRAVLDEGLPLRVSLEGTGQLPEVMGDPGALGAAFLSVVRNAAQASPGGVLRIGAATDGREVVLRFRDDGPGVPAEIRPRIFDPFFTTRRVGEGVGLGLTQAHFVARDHGGSVGLEPSGEGACFVFRFPARERRAMRPVPDAWALSGAALLSAAMATSLALMSPNAGRAWWAFQFQVGAALLAAAALAAAGLRHRGRARRFWLFLAAGPALWAVARMLGLGALEGSRPSGVWAYLVSAAGELAWAAALLLRPDLKPERGASARSLLGAGAALCCFAYFYMYLVVLPWPFSEGEAVLGQHVALGRGLVRAALALWAFVLSRRVASGHWRIAFGRLALVFVAWAAGQTAADYGRTVTGFAGGTPADLGWIVPYLLLAAVALAESRRRWRPEPHFASYRPFPFGAAASLASVALLPAFDALVGSSGHPALDAARDDLTAFAVVALGALLALRELARDRGVGASAATGAADASQQVLPRLVANAVYELGGQLSGIAALARLLLAQRDLPGRAREDARRIRRRGDSGLRLASNVIAAMRGTSGPRDFVSVNLTVQEVIGERSADLGEEDIRLQASLSEAVPPLSVNVTALRQAVLSCVDAAAVDLRAAGGGATIEVVTAVEDDQVLVGVRHGEGATARATRIASGDLDPGLGLAREIVSQLGGTLVGGSRALGGLELWIRLPVPRPVASSAARRGPAAGAGSA